MIWARALRRAAPAVPLPVGGMADLAGAVIHGERGGMTAGEKARKYKEAEKMDTIKRMRYSQYKEHYSDCRTVPGTYDKINRSIEVVIPEGRMKPSGVRGERFYTYQLAAVVEDGRKCYLGYKAVSIGNALKQHHKWCAENGWQALDEDQLGRTF